MWDSHYNLKRIWSLCRFSTFPSGEGAVQGGWLQPNYRWWLGLRPVYNYIKYRQLPALQLVLSELRQQARLIGHPPPPQHAWSKLVVAMETRCCLGVGEMYQVWRMEEIWNEMQTLQVGRCFTGHGLEFPVCVCMCVGVGVGGANGPPACVM